MAQLESIRFTPHRSTVVDGKILWTPTRSPPVPGLPQICWENGLPWREANLWLFERTCERNVSLKTVVANATALHAYARWLEATTTSWWDFPVRKADRCLVKYRGALVQARDEGELSPSTVSARMRVAIAFYRWVRAAGLLSPTWPMWNERSIGIRIADAVGLERTLMVTTTDLAIPNRARPGTRLEDGLLPVSSSDRDAILELAQQRGSEELALILAVGFFTGMRLGTICDLKVATLLDAATDPEVPGLYRFSLGPGATTKVATKLGVTGQVWVPAQLVEQLRAYAYSARRLQRVDLAATEFQHVLFLTRYGNPYALRGADKSAALNVEIHRLRKIGSAKIQSLRRFRFHQTRATFGTQLAKHLLKVGGAINAVAMVAEQLLHRNEAMSLRYIRFVEMTPAKEEAANAFTREFFGVFSRALGARHAGT